jgi:hypothetical protein
LLQRCFVFAPFVVDLEQLVDLDFIAAATCRQPFLDEIRPFANQTNVEHVAIVDAALWAAQRKRDPETRPSRFAERNGYSNPRVTIIRARR